MGRCILGSYGTMVIKLKKMVAKFGWNSTWMHSIIGLDHTSMVITTGSNYLIFICPMVN